MDDEHTTTGSSIYHVDKLIETNYRSWAQQLRWILDERELWELVDGKEGKPEPPAATSAAITTSTATSTTGETGVLPTQTATQEYQERLTAWTRKAKKARSIIGSSISASSMIYIENIDNPAEM